MGELGVTGGCEWDGVGVRVPWQVLVSVQGLVLVPLPYFNEAGYEKQRGTAEGERNALVYNESAFLLSCKTMLYTLRKRPKVRKLQYSTVQYGAFQWNTSQYQGQGGTGQDSHCPTCFCSASGMCSAVPCTWPDLA